MCRWIAYKGAPTFLDTQLLKPANSLISQSRDCRHGASRTNGDGFGIGWYGLRRQPGVYREILPAWNDPNLRALARQIQSPLFFAHVRASTGTETARANCHPFAHDNWLFMHNGEVGGYDHCRRELEAQLCDDLYEFRLGSTDSELFFLLMVQNGLASDAQAAIRKTIGQVTEIAGGDHDRPLVMTICVSDGTRLYACRHASAGTPPSLFWRVSGRDLLIASEPLDDKEAGWNEVGPDTLLCHDGQLDISPLYHPAKAVPEPDTSAVVA